MSRSDLLVTSFDPAELKQSLIEFLKTTDDFNDFDYDGSAINTIIDLLTRNTHYVSYMANMVANESFLDSAQLRSSVISHASKLSYVPRSRTATRLFADITVVPSDNPTNETLILDQGKSFLGNVGGTVYNFVNIDQYELQLTNGVYSLSDVELFQGQFIRTTHVYTGDKIYIQNKNIDTSTLRVSVFENGDDVAYERYTSIHNDLSRNYYFLSLSKNDEYIIEFGDDIIGKEPSSNSVVTISYVNTEKTFANGISSVIAGSTIGGYSNIALDVTTAGFGGAERESIESIRFLSPQIYQAQERALTDSDYAPIIRSQYPFIRSIITWGGEDNQPPVYGSVFLSIISDEGAFLSRAVKDDIVNFVSQYNVGSVTPEIVDPVPYGVNIHTRIYRDAKTSPKTFNELSLEVRQTINDYNEQEVNDFNRFFNLSKLYDDIMDIRGIESSTIDYEVFFDLDVLRFNNPEYTVNYYNPIEKGSVTATGFSIAVNGSDHKLYDEDGILYVSYLENNALNTIQVGTVDYLQGRLDFIMNMIQEEDTLRISVTLSQNNFYAFNNSYIFIDGISISPLTIRRE